MDSSQLPVVAGSILILSRVSTTIAGISVPVAAVASVAAAVPSSRPGSDLDAVQLVPRRGHRVPESVPHGPVVPLRRGGLGDMNVTFQHISFAGIFS